MPEVLVGGHVIARQLKAEGTTCIFTLCGGHIAPIYDGCLREGIDIIDTRHEQAAVHAADGWSRLTRGCGVAVITAGPGVTDGVTGVANAYQASIPLLVLGGASELRFKGKGALQEMEQTSLLAPITKASFTATDPKRLAEYIRTGFRIATSGVPGPVFIELPFDVLTSQITDPAFPPPPRPWPAQPGDPTGIAGAAQLIAAAEKPMIFAGSQVYWDGAWAELVALAERAQIPVFTNAMGRGCIDSRHPLAFSQARKNAFRGTDLAIILGTPLDFRVGYGAGINAKAKIVQIERDPTKVAQNRDADVAILGDAKSVLGQLAAAAGAATGKTAGWIEELRGAETKATGKLLDHAASDARPINQYRLAKAIGEVIDDDTIVIGDGGDCVALGAKLVLTEGPRGMSGAVAKACGEAVMGRPLQIVADESSVHEEMAKARS